MKINGVKFLFLLACPLVLAGWAAACPLCFASTPYQSGLVWAALFLLPIPFILAFFLLLWIRRAG